MAVNSISSNLAYLKRHIQQIANQSGRSAEEITLVAVSKTRTLDDVKLAIEAGQKDFGENTIQDALTKIPELEATDARWHFIGHLQSNKAKQIPGNFHWIHSVDSLKLAQKLSHAMEKSPVDEPLNCLIQVNVVAEASKSGLNSGDVVPFVERLLSLELPRLRWRGLMTIGVQGDDKQTRTAFIDLRHLLEQCQQEFALVDFNQLSMGMTKDYPIAIEEGATLIRVGTAIFGHRKA
jgi:pyridoxal phosphate enzyme (YggS family)